MKKRRIINFLIIVIVFTSLSFGQKKDSLKSISIYCLPIINTKSKFNEFEFSSKLKKQLNNYHLQVFGVQEIRDGKAFFTTKHLDKYFFKDYYIVYKNDLNKYLPKPPDFTRIYFRNKH